MPLSAWQEVEKAIVASRSYSRQLRNTISKCKLLHFQLDASHAAAGTFRCFPSQPSALTCPQKVYMLRQPSK